MAICAVAWLVSHVRMLGRDEREKPQTMIRQLVTPLYGEHTLQFYNERYKQLKQSVFSHTHTYTKAQYGCSHQCLSRLCFLTLSPEWLLWAPSWSTCVPTSSNKLVQLCVHQWMARSPSPTGTCCRPKTPFTCPSASSSKRCYPKAGWTARHCICLTVFWTWEGSFGSQTTWSR